MSATARASRPPPRRLERALPIAIASLAALSGGWLLVAAPTGGPAAPSTPYASDASTRAPVRPSAPAVAESSDASAGPSGETPEGIEASGAGPEAAGPDAAEAVAVRPRPVGPDAAGAVATRAIPTGPGIAEAAAAESGVAGAEAADAAGTAPPERVAVESAEPDPTEPSDPQRRGTAVVPPELHDAVVVQNRELAAEVAALEAETVALEREMLALDLRLAAALAAGGDGSGSEGLEPIPAPIELGNTTLVPPPLVGGLGERDARAPDTAWNDDVDVTYDETDDPFLPDASVNDGLAGDDAFDDGTRSYDVIDAAASYAARAVDEGGSGRAAASASASLAIERLIVGSVLPGGPAAVAGLEPGDVLLAIDGLPIVDFEQVLSFDNGNPAPMHEVVVLRGEERRRVLLASSPVMLSLEMRTIDSARLIE